MIYFLIWLIVSVFCTGFVLLCVRSAPLMDDEPLDSVGEGPDHRWLDQDQRNDVGKHAAKAGFGRRDSQSRHPGDASHRPKYVSKAPLFSGDQETR